MLKRERGILFRTARAHRAIESDIIWKTAVGTWAYVSEYRRKWAGKLGQMNIIIFANHLYKARISESMQVVVVVYS